MNIQPLINAIRYKLRYGITVEWYNFWYMALRCHQKITPQVASIDETIRIIIEDQCSVSRFGDGEMLLTNPDKEIGFQKGNVLLAQRLKEVLTSHEEGHLVCILGIAVKGEQVGLAPVPVRMQGHEQAVERADGNTFRIKFRKALARSVEPVSPGIRRFVQSRGEQLYLTLLGILFYLRFFFHIPIFFRLQDY